MMRSPGPIGGIITGGMSTIVVPDPPPPAPTDPFIASVRYLLHGSEYDGTANAFEATIGTEGVPSLIASNGTTRPTADTVRSRFGQSIRLHQVHNDARAINEQDRGWPSNYLELDGDFTIEISIYLDSQNEQIVVGTHTFSGAATNGWWFSINNPGSASISFAASDGNNPSNYITCKALLPDNEFTDANGMLLTGMWHNIAIERYGSTWSIYHQGTRYNPTMAYGSGLSATSKVGGTSSSALCFGSWYLFGVVEHSYSLIGSIEEFRFTDAARYQGAASYTVATAAFPNS